MIVDYYELKAFCNKGEGGNYLGVVLKVVSDETKQKIAKKLGYSETVFIERTGKREFRLDYFTPSNRINLCGHATIGAFHLLKDMYQLEGIYRYYNDEIDLRIRIENELIIMEQKKVRYINKKINKKAIADSLNIGMSEISETEIEIVSTGVEDIIIPIKNLEVMKGIKPNFKRVEELSKEYGVVGYHLFTMETLENNTAFTRNLAPLYEIDEEPATGTSNGALACYIKKNRLINQDKMTFEQGDFMGYSSRIFVELDGEIPWVGGTAKLEKRLKLKL